MTREELRDELWQAIDDRMDIDVSYTDLAEACVERLEALGLFGRETAWLIEMIMPENNKPPSPRWWHPGKNLGWMWDANKALRFARKIDAEDYVASQPYLHGKATDHAFVSLPRKQEAA